MKYDYVMCMYYHYYYYYYYYYYYTVEQSTAIRYVLVTGSCSYFYNVRRFASQMAGGGKGGGRVSLITIL